MSTASSAASAPLSALEDWLVAAGGWLSGACVLGESAAGERGLFAASPLAEDDVLLCVPAKLIVTAGSASGRSLPPGVSEADAIALVLLEERERGASSAWAAWLPTVPVTFGLPMLWDDEAAWRSLRCPMLSESVRQQRADASERLAALRAGFQAVAPAATPPAYLEEGAYLWALSALESRGAFLSGHLGADSWAIVPVGDLFNHATDASVVAAYDPDTRCYVYRATRDVALGDELTVCYGPHDDSTLLQSYGFVLGSANHHRRVRLQLSELGIAPADGGDWLEEHGLATDLAIEPDGPSYALLAALRLKHATGAQREGGAAFAILEGEPVSEDNEHAAWAEFRALARGRLALLSAGADPEEPPPPPSQSSGARPSVEQQQLQLASVWREAQRGVLREALEAKQRTR